MFILCVFNVGARAKNVGLIARIILAYWKQELFQLENVENLQHNKPNRQIALRGLSGGSGTLNGG